MDLGQEDSQWTLQNRLEEALHFLQKHLCEKRVNQGWVIFSQEFCKGHKSMYNTDDMAIRQADQMQAWEPWAASEWKRIQFRIK